MPSVTVTSLERENNSLKEEIATLRRGFENPQFFLQTVKFMAIAPEQPINIACELI